MFESIENSSSQREKLLNRRIVFSRTSKFFFDVMRSCNCCIQNISAYDNNVITSNCRNSSTHFNDAKITLYRCQMQKILWNEIYICFNCSQAWVFDISKRMSRARIARTILRSCNATQLQQCTHAYHNDVMTWFYKSHLAHFIAATMN